MNLSSLTYFLKNCPKRSGKLGLWRELRVVCQKLYDVFHVIDVSRYETKSSELVSSRTGDNFSVSSLDVYPVVTLFNPFTISNVSNGRYGQLSHIALVSGNSEFIVPVSAAEYNAHNDTITIYASSAQIILPQGTVTSEMHMEAFFVYQEDSSYWTE